MMHLLANLRLPGSQFIIK